MWHPLRYSAQAMGNTCWVLGHGQPFQASLCMWGNWSAKHWDLSCHHTSSGWRPLPMYMWGGHPPNRPCPCPPDFSPLHALRPLQGTSWALPYKNDQNTWIHWHNYPWWEPGHWWWCVCVQSNNPPSHHGGDGDVSTGTPEIDDEQVELEWETEEGEDGEQVHHNLLDILHVSLNVSWGITCHATPLASFFYINISMSCLPSHLAPHPM